MADTGAAHGNGKIYNKDSTWDTGQLRAVNRCILKVSPRKQGTASGIGNIYITEIPPVTQSTER
jgi:hypothetical protein